MIEVWYMVDTIGNLMSIEDANVYVFRGGILPFLRESANDDQE
jgi:hypothetical protein